MLVQLCVEEVQCLIGKRMKGTDEPYNLYSDWSVRDRAGETTRNMRYMLPKEQDASKHATYLSCAGITIWQGSERPTQTAVEGLSAWHKQNR